MNYSASDRFRATGSKPINQKDEEETKPSTKTEKDGNQESRKTPNRMEENDTSGRTSDNESAMLMMISRGTSPTAPASSSYVRNKRAEIGIVQQKEMARARKPPETTDKGTQCDRVEETSRYSRYAGGNGVSCAPWSTYLDKYSSAGGSPMYSSRGFANATSASGRLNSFAYARKSDASNARSESTSKELTSNPSQESHNSSNRNQSEKVPGDGSSCTRTGHENSSSSNDSKASSSSRNVHGTNKGANEQAKVAAQGGEQCCCGARKTEKNGGSSRTFNQDLAFHRGDDSTTWDYRERNGGREDRSNGQSPASKCDEYNPRRPSIPRLERNSSKGETKILKSVSKTGSTSPKPEIHERRGSTPRSDVSSSSKTDESLRIVEGYCQDQNEEVISHKRDVSHRKDSTSRYVVNIF